MHEFLSFSITGVWSWYYCLKALDNYQQVGGKKSLCRTKRVCCISLANSSQGRTTTTTDGKQKKTSLSNIISALQSIDEDFNCRTRPEGSIKKKSGNKRKKRLGFKKQIISS